MMLFEYLDRSSYPLPMQSTRVSKTAVQDVQTPAGQTGKGGISLPAVPVLQQMTPVQNIDDFQGQRGEQRPVQTKAYEPKPDPTGMPGQLRSGIEQLSGFSLENVKVHYNSDKPAQLQAHAYAQGTDIHLGPSQERHLPHEAWHVVQQAQGRVRPTAQLESGVTVNDETALEAESDQMSATALQTVQRREALTPFSPKDLKPIHTTQAAPAQLVNVKIQAARSRGGSDTYVLGTPSDLDTATMSLETRRKVLKDLQNATQNGKMRQAVAALSSEIAAMSSPVDEKLIIQMTGEIDKLLAKKEAKPLSAEDQTIVKKIAFQTLNAMEFLGGFNEGEKDAEKFRVLLLANIQKLNRLEEGVFNSSREYARGGGNLNILPQEMAAYREDIRNGSAWGGGSEASAIATAFNHRVSVYIIDSENKYVLVDTVGTGAVAGFSILNIGNHYVAIANGRATGTAYAEDQIVFNPAGDGDCMFNALYYALSNGNTVVLNHPTSHAALNEGNFVANAREIAATGISDQQVTLSIQEILVSGQMAGVGSGLRKFMNFKQYSVQKIRDLVKRSGLEEAEIMDAVLNESGVSFKKKLTFSQLLENYSNLNENYAKAAKTSAEEAGAFVEKMHLVIGTLLKKLYSGAVDTEDLLDEKPSAKTELDLRKAETEKYRHVYKVKTSEHNEKQLIITVEEEEFVIDRIGQLVPQKVSRSISDQNATEMREHGFIYPSGQSPVSYAGGSTGSGISDNKVKATPEMLHVEGAKPSPFLSTTREAAGTVNPEGISFGSALYEMDLAYVPSSGIADLSTGRGISYYMLGNYEPGAEGDSKAELIRQAGEANDKQTEYRKQLADHNKKVSGVKKPTLYDAQVKATENPTLSGKEWQALMDIVRTTEVLINVPIPKEALKKK